MKTVVVREKKHIGRVLLRHFQNQLHNIKVLILSISLLLLIGSSTNTSASTEKNKINPSNSSSSKKQKSKGLISKFYELAEDTDTSVRAELAETVGKTGNLEALKLLEKMATDKDFNVRKAAVKALGQTGRPEALKLLEKIIKEDKQEKQFPPYYNKNIKETALTAIMEINKEAVSFLTYYSGLQREKTEKQKKTKRYYRKNRLSDKNIYNQMIQNAKNKTQVEKQAIDLANQTKKKTLQLLNILAEDKNPRVQQEVAIRTGYTNNPTKALNLLEKMIKQENKQKPGKYSNYQNIKIKIIYSILRIHENAHSFLMYLGSQREKTEKQKKTKRYYRKNRLSDKNIYNQMIQLSAHKKRAEEQAIKLANQTKKKAFQLLNTLVKDKNFKVRKAVAYSTPKVDSLDAISLLEKLIKDKEPEVRKEIANSLGKINNPKAIHLLNKLAKDQNKNVRISAIQAMGELNKN